MGAYLANGIAIRITAYGKIQNKKEAIVNALSNFVDINTYHITEEEKYIIFDIDKEFFEKNIHECLKEISKMFGTDFFEYYNNKKNNISNTIVNDADFNQENFPIELNMFDSSYDNEHYKKSGEYYIQIEDGKPTYNEVNHFSPYYGNYWITLGNLELDDVKFGITIAANWMDFPKYLSEDCTWQLRILNTMKMSYYKNPLSKNLIYYVEGL